MFEKPAPTGAEKKRMPCCPNHGEPLEGLPVPMTNKGTGVCPISKCHFDYEVDLDAETTEYIKDHTGALVAVPVYKLVGEEQK